MSFSEHYDQGSMVGRELFELFTPSTVMAMMSRVNNGAIVMARDMKGAPVSGSLKLSFELFKKNWDSFYDDHQGWFSRSLNTTYDMVQSFGQQLDTYRSALIREGGKTAVPPIKALGKGGIELSPAGIALTVAAGVLLFTYLKK